MVDKHSEAVAKLSMLSVILAVVEQNSSELINVAVADIHCFGVHQNDVYQA
ncbi:hypothetical protein EV682_10960 [Iodobacter fluviatilis]|uniref:Uncharacterized protein n=1 Tax=Iodobacter fluviatilis TaxID=537 RepID=A0A377Q827_9NEIS|nr:hypothetical protein EV682_10960 [Iodobacter fluviatilis]STQ90001.1 Uncharacterised protein [Iodobacter fluviatilis]